MKRSAHQYLWQLFLLVLVGGPWAAMAVHAQGEAKPQVRIEARILEWQITNGLDFDFAVRYQRGTDSGGILDSLDLTLPAEPSLGSATRLFFDGLDVASGSFDVMIEALETAGKVEYLAKPSIILTSAELPDDQISNGEAIKGANRGTIKNNQEIPYETAAAAGNRLVSFTEYEKSGLTLDVAVLKVFENGDVLIDLNTNVSDLVGFVRVGLNDANKPLSVPMFDERSISNRLIIPDRTVFLAGLMKTTRDVKRKQGIPWLSEIPLLEWMTTSRRNRYEDTELVFLIKPEILAARPTLAEFAAAEPAKP